jgi:glycosyltransferase involved in cell wall biosynthesis
VRIVLATNHLMVGGAEAQLVRLARRLVERGDEVGILSLLPTTAYAEVVDALGIPIAHCPNRRRFRALTYIGFETRQLRRWKPDIVLSFLYQANVVARVAGRLAGVPVVVSSVRNERLGGRRRELMLRATDRLATITTTNSAIVADSLVARGVVPRGRLTVVPNGLDLETYRGSGAQRDHTRAQMGVDRATLVWLSIARLEPQKDVSTLLRAFARYRADHPDDALWIAGDGRLRSGLEAEAARLNIARAVRFLGIRDDIPPLLAGCDALVQSSAWEGLPNAVMEAMAAGRPVVATRVGGTPELVDDGRTGLLVPAQDAVALSAAMAQVAALPEDARRAMGERGRAAVAERHSFDSVAAVWLALLDGLLSQVETAPRARPPLAGTQESPGTGRRFLRLG